MKKLLFIVLFFITMYFIGTLIPDDTTPGYVWPECVEDTHHNAEGICV